MTPNSCVFLFSVACCSLCFPVVGTLGCSSHLFPLKDAYWSCHISRSGAHCSDYSFNDGSVRFQSPNRSDPAAPEGSDYGREGIKIHAALPPSEKYPFTLNHLSQRCNVAGVHATYPFSVFHAGAELVMWTPSWMLKGPCNKAFEVCNTLLQNYNVKIPLWMGKVRPAWHLRSLPHLTPLFSPHHVSLISHPVLPCSLLISPHLLIMTSGRRTCLALLGLRWQAGFSKYQHVDLVIRGKKVRQWTQQGGEVDYWVRGFRWSKNGLWLVRVRPLWWIIMSTFHSIVAFL